ncbi:hypothetical protein C1M53_15765 [Mesorhizobium sp. Pch-S]|nr:hypothetical protein C1M53_15765 [Mesorhizobium sp. Pch-S]
MFRALRALTLAFPCFQNRLCKTARSLDEIAFHIRGLFKAGEIIFKFASYAIPNIGFGYAYLLDERSQRCLNREEPRAERDIVRI